MYTVESHYCNSRWPNGRKWLPIATVAAYEEPTARAVAQGYVLFTGLEVRVCKDGRPIATYTPTTLDNGTPWVRLADTPCPPVVLP